MSIAKRLDTMLRPEDTVARIANKSFCVLFEGLSEQEDLQTLVNRLDAILKPSFHFEDREIFVETSMGAVLNHSRYEQADPMLRDAEIAMNRAKYNKISSTIFDEFMYHDVVSRLNLETDLRYALKRNEFHFRYQPILDLKGETIIGVEALLRWQHGKEGTISPADFIPVAEESGLIVEIDKWVLKHALQEIAAWQQSSNNTAYVAINVSSQSLESSDFFDYLDDCLAKTQVAPQGLRLELTEYSLMQDATVMIERLRKLREKGVAVHIDDFGTGYSSLSYLHALPVDVLKIDKSFIEHIEQDSAIVQTILALAKQLNIKVVAEGVENEEQAYLLKRLDCDFVQGYYYAKPLALEDLKALGLNLTKSLNSTLEANRPSTMFSKN